MNYEDFKRELYEEVGYMDETEFKVAFNDVDFCLRIREKGYLVVYNPFVEFWHYESKSRGQEDSPEKIKRFRVAARSEGCTKPLRQRKRSTRSKILILTLFRRFRSPFPGMLYRLRQSVRGVWLPQFHPVLPDYVPLEPRYQP